MAPFKAAIAVSIDFTSTGGYGARRALSSGWPLLWPMTDVEGADKWPDSDGDALED